MTASKRGAGKARGTKQRGRGRRVGQPRRRRPLPGSTHVTPAGGNIFAELGFPPDQAENLKMRAQMMVELRHIIGEMAQAEAAALLGVSQPRISHLMRGKIGLFTIDTLVNMLARAGAQTRLSVKRPGRSAA